MRLGEAQTTQKAHANRAKHSKTIYILYASKRQETSDMKTAAELEGKNFSSNNKQNIQRRLIEVDMTKTSA